MQKLPLCRRCQFYADSSFLVCALHPQGISEENNCSNFNTAKETFHREHRFKLEDLDLTEGLLLNQGYRDLEAHHRIAALIAEMLYDPAKDLLKQPLSDFYYYVLRLSQLMTKLTRFSPLELPDDC